MHDVPAASPRDTVGGMDALRTWTARRWAGAAVAALAIAVVVGAPTDIVPNPVFGRAQDVTWWSYPVLVATALLGGLLLATYIAEPTDADPATELDRPGRAGGAGGLLSFFAVGCPTCNKLVVLALGSSGALDWFAPAQPVLAVLSLGLLAWALRARLASSTRCTIAV